MSCSEHKQEAGLWIHSKLYHLLADSRQVLTSMRLCFFIYKRGYDTNNQVTCDMNYATLLTQYLQMLTGCQLTESCSHVIIQLTRSKYYSDWLELAIKAMVHKDQRNRKEEKNKNNT